MSAEALIHVDGVSKKFCKDLKRSLWYGMRDLAGEVLGHAGDDKDTLRPDEFWAVNGISFKLKRGECLGLVGRNGAGKTTILRMLNGLIKPDQGRIEMRGKIGSLIALGAGFNPVLTGRENIYVNAAVLGLSKRETDKRLEEIIDFSEIHDSIDAPVQTYSSGMIVRLGFSIASTIEPDILLLDEVLAVGDVDFQIKCGNKIKELSRKCAVIFVSHNMQYVSAFCTRAMLLGRGQIILDSPDPNPVIEKYLEQDTIPEYFTCTGGVSLDCSNFLHPGGQSLEKPYVIDQGSSLAFRCRLHIGNELEAVKLSLALMDNTRNGVISFPVVDKDTKETKFASGTHDVHLQLGHIELNSGSYSLMVVVQEYVTQKTVLRHEGVLHLQVRAPNMKSVARIIRPVSPTDVQIARGEKLSNV